MGQFKDMDLIPADAVGSALITRLEEEHVREVFQAQFQLVSLEQANLAGERAPDASVTYAVYLGGQTDTPLVLGSPNGVRAVLEGLRTYLGWMSQALLDNHNAAMLRDDLANGRIDGGQGGN